MDGVIVVDKPAGISSHGAVQRMRRIAGERRVGHLGTLDPLGTGVLPLVIGKATRLSQFFLSHDREYLATIRFGFATNTYDREGEPLGAVIEPSIERVDLEAAMEPFRGPIEQTPPPISAKKIAGVPAYKLARRNQPVELKPVTVEIHELELLDLDGAFAKIRMRTSSGAYVRSLAHDLGVALNCGAHVTELRRTAMGEFDIESAHPFEELEALAAEGCLEEALSPGARLLPALPAHRIDEATAGRIAHGMDFQVSSFHTTSPAKRIKAIGPDGRLVAIGEIRLPGTYHPIVVF